MIYYCDTENNNNNPTVVIDLTNINTLLPKRTVIIADLNQQLPLYNNENANHDLHFRYCNWANIGIPIAYKIRMTLSNKHRGFKHKYNYTYFKI